jgi:hypothetical protein
MSQESNDQFNSIDPEVVALMQSLSNEMTVVDGAEQLVHDFNKHEEQLNRAVRIISLLSMLRIMEDPMDVEEQMRVKPEGNHLDARILKKIEAQEEEWKRKLFEKLREKWPNRGEPQD